MAILAASFVENVGLVNSQVSYSVPSKCKFMPLATNNILTAGMSECIILPTCNIQLGLDP